MDCFSNWSTPRNAPPCRYTWMHPCTTAAAMDLGRRAAGIVAAAANPPAAPWTNVRDQGADYSQQWCIMPTHSANKASKGGTR